MIFRDGTAKGRPTIGIAAKERKFGAGLRTRCWSLKTSLPLTMSFAPLVLIESKGMQYVPWMISICVYLRPSAVLVFCVLCDLLGLSCLLCRPFAALRLCVRFF